MTLLVITAVAFRRQQAAIIYLPDTICQRVVDPGLLSPLKS
jgi:hypothetical protein